MTAYEEEEIDDYEDDENEVFYYQCMCCGHCQEQSFDCRKCAGATLKKYL